MQMFFIKYKVVSSRTTGKQRPVSLSDLLGQLGPVHDILQRVLVGSVSVAKIRGPHLASEVVDSGMRVLGGDVLTHLTTRPGIFLRCLDFLVCALCFVQLVSISSVDLDAAAARGQVEALLPETNDPSQRTYRYYL